MIKFDFNTYIMPFIDSGKYQKYCSQKNYYINKLINSNMVGWTKQISKKTIEDIKETAKYIKNNFECLVVVGIGGSFLGSYAFHEMFKKYFNDESFEIIYAGTTLSSKYLDELLIYLENKNFCLNVISKSGTTMETNIYYEELKKMLKRKYSDVDIKKRIVITTSKDEGKLREDVLANQYKSFEIPNDIGGRFSFITPAHLLPLAMNYDIEKIIDGYYDGKKLIDKAFEYSIIRKLLFEKGKIIENFCVFEQNMQAFTEWLKQVFGETEGKKGVGIYPTSSVYTKDLHSLGQFIQEGNKIVFETFIKVEDTNNFIEYKNKNLHEINNIVLLSTMNAHFKGLVPCIEISIKRQDLETISSLIYFFMLSAVFSGFLFDVNPFNQPGVEMYKKESLDNLGVLWKRNIF